MKSRLIAIALFLALGACSSTQPTTDGFVVMAEAWQGASINEMLAVWGDGQSSALPDPGSGNDTGFIKWVIDQRPYGSSTSGSSLRSHCEVTAHFDMDGTISSIDTVSQNCAKLTRPGYYGRLDLSRP